MLAPEEWTAFINHPLLGKTYPLPKLIGKQTKKRKVRRCDDCPGCRSTVDCMECKNCESKHFGDNLRKQICVTRRCHRPVIVHSPS